MFEKQNNGRKILTRKNIKKNQKEKVQIKQNIELSNKKNEEETRRNWIKENVKEK